MRRHIANRVLLASVLVLFVSSAQAYGPWYAGPQVGYNGNAYYGYGLGYGLGYGVGYSGPQTPYSAAATGMGNLIRAEGAYNEQSSQAAVNYELARRQYIENQQRAIAARQSNKRLTLAEDAKKLEAAHARMARGEEFLAAHRPPPLSQSQLDPSTGKIQWPVALLASDFDNLRKTLDGLFESRAKNGSTSEVTSQIDRTTGELKDALRVQLLNIPLSDYSEARKFLDSMAMTAR